MALLQKMYEARLSELKEEVCRNPDADFTPVIQTLAAEFAEREKAREENVINKILRYGKDIQAFRQELRLYVTKISLADSAKPVPSSYVPLFRWLCEVLSLQTKEDLSDILAMCDQIENASRLEDRKTDALFQGQSGNSEP